MRIRTWSLVAMLALLVLVAARIGITGAYFSDLDASTSNNISAWSSSLWRQTTKADFDSGVVTNVDTAASPGDVILPASGTVSDHYDDQSKVASLTNMRVTGGCASLSPVTPYTIRPNGDGTTALSRSGGESNFTAVDDVTADEDATYVYTAGASWAADLYDLADVAGTGTITGVTVHVRARTTVAVATPTLRVELYTGSTTYSSSDLITTTSYADYSKTWSVNPKTSVAWSWSDVNDLKAGPGIVAASGQTRVTQVWVTVDRAGFSPTGTLISIDLLAGSAQSAISSFEYTAATVPSGTTARVQFSRDNSAWYSSAGVLNGFDTFSVGTHTLGLSALGWPGPHIYYKLSLTTTGSATPTIDQSAIHYSQTSGSLASSVLDTAGSAAKWDALCWDQTLPAGTSLTLYARASDSPFAKDASSPSWAAAGSPSPVRSGLPAGRYKQWRADLATTDVSKTPVLFEVRVYWSQ